MRFSQLTDILRDAWGFDGHVVSDCGGVDHIWAMHHAVPDLSEGEKENVVFFCAANLYH